MMASGLSSDHDGAWWRHHGSRRQKGIGCERLAQEGAVLIGWFENSPS